MGSLVKSPEEEYLAKPSWHDSYSFVNSPDRRPFWECWEWVRKIGPAGLLAPEKLPSPSMTLVNYPEIPPPMGWLCPIKSMERGLPAIEMPRFAGVYFVWEQFNDSMAHIVYVGQAICLSSRVRLSHEKIELHNLISYLRVRPTELNNAERYYISRIAPWRNDQEYVKKERGY